MHVQAVLVVAPFDCLWLDGDSLTFPEAGKGRVSFEVRGENDATVILKDTPGHRHYRTDLGRNYTVVIGSHRNRSIRIQADGKSVAEVEDEGVLDAHQFRRFWINVWDGVVTVGKGSDCKEILLQFADRLPNMDVKFIGLSSWDKHVAYKNVRIQEGLFLPLQSSLQTYSTAAPQVSDFLNSPVFSDATFLVGDEQALFSAHMLVLASNCEDWQQLPWNRSKLGPSDNEVVYCQLRNVQVKMFQLLLQLTYGEAVQASPAEVKKLAAVASGFSFTRLSQVCQAAVQGLQPTTETVEISLLQPRLTSNKQPTARAHSQKETDTHPGQDFWPSCEGLGRFFCSSFLSDVTVRSSSCDTTFPAHRLVLSTWSCVLHRMLCTDMVEGRTQEVVLGETSCGAVWIMLYFFYNNRLPQEVGELDTCGHMQCQNCTMKLQDSFWCDSPRSCSTNSEDLEDCSGPLSPLREQLFNSEDNSCATMKLLSVLHLADRLCIPALLQSASTSLSTSLEPDSVLEVLEAAAKVHGSEKLHARALEFAAGQLREAIMSKPHVFIRLPVLDVCTLLEDCDRSNVSEELLFDAAVSWLLCLPDVGSWRAARSDCCSTNKDEEAPSCSRLPLADRILTPLSFCLMPRQLLEDLLESPLCILLPCIKEKAEGALERLSSMEDNLARTWEHSLHIDKGRRLVRGWTGSSYNSPVKSRSSPSPGVELEYICDGDTNGVLFHSGTSHGKQPWMNPVALGTIQIAASSPPSRHTDGKILASRKFAGTCYAGPASIDGSQTAWWQVDLGEGHTLLCNAYTLRQDGSNHFPRSWVLEGFNDEDGWHVLHNHVDDCSLSQAGQFSTWRIHRSSGSAPCRFFRVRLTAPSSQSSWQFCVCFVELYGMFA